MSLIKSALNLLSGGIIGEIGDAINKNVTSDEERGKLQNELATIQAKANGKVMEFESKIEDNITSRHDADMKSDSILAKNIRPIVLASLTLFTLAYILFSSDEPVRYNASLGILTSLDMMVYGFYFGSRGVEKAAVSVAAILKKPKKYEDDGDLGW